MRKDIRSPERTLDHKTSYFHWFYSERDRHTDRDRVAEAERYRQTETYRQKDRDN